MNTVKAINSGIDWESPENRAIEAKRQEWIKRFEDIAGKSLQEILKEGRDQPKRRIA